MTQANFEAARLTVRLGAIDANYRTMRRLAGAAVAAAVVKADAYGLGADSIAPHLAAAGCDTFFVARLEEGIALRPLLPDARIFVLDGAPADAIAALIAHRLTPVLSSLDDIAAWSKAAGRGGLEAAIQFDTGMNRLGLPPDDLATLAAEWRTRLAGLNLVLLMSHLACADEPKSKMNAEQLSRFRLGLAMLPPAPASLAASSGILLGADYAFDLVRPGVALYGANPCPGRPSPVVPAAVLTGKILQLRRIDRGQSVGYAATYRAKRAMTLATVALGYADGVPRALSNKGFGAFQGSLVPLVGRVSMDLVTLDVSAIPPTRIKVGDGIELLGDTVLLDDVAANAGTNGYEILTGLGRRAPRAYQG
jgi:alanine racemase